MTLWLTAYSGPRAAYNNLLAADIVLMTAYIIAANKDFFRACNDLMVA